MPDGRAARVAAELLAPRPRVINWSRIAQPLLASERLAFWRDRWDRAHAAEVVHGKVALSRFVYHRRSMQLELATGTTDWREAGIVQLALEEHRDLAEALIRQVRTQQVFGEPTEARPFR